ncbi:molybdopterin biosynthesis protein MoeB [Corynebacterium renale]|uniref:ThiF family adenylyltransferase n=1 Tax=Corynebacterium renale TaxID=1724 RepID=UPI000DA303C9|nr:ThiF family adenylyltransferase [Corynebacterium renale]SQG64470.1 molybdopterin biosynthesis protein MoeB [Corynebacterium renale]
MNNEQAHRYIRQTTLAGFGTQAQEKLLDAHVAVIGAGGLGSPALLYLAGAGVGTITVIDDDTVDVTNLHRQVIHTDAAVGTLKVDSAREQMLALNPTIHVRTYAGRLTEANALHVLEDADVVLDGADNFATRHIASWACTRLGIPHVWASILGFESQLSVFWAGHGPVYEDIFPNPPAPGSVPSCAQAGVLGPHVGITGSAMALEALKLLSGVGTPLVGKLGYFDAMTGSWEYIPLSAEPAVAEHIREHGPVMDPASLREVDTIPEGAVLIDVREPFEFATGAIPGALNFPLSAVQRGAIPNLPDDQPVVVYCAGGVRSLAAMDIWEQQGLRGMKSYRGGYQRWISQH